MNLTPKQQAVVEHRQGALIVSASAGSGKTEVLARRCAALIADPAHPCGVEQLLVVTFTRAAAAEMRSRIARELRAAAARAADRALRARLRREVVLVDAASITTFDGWCGRVLREFASTAGIDPAFTTLPPEDDAILRQRTRDAALDDLYRSDEPLAREVRDWLGRRGGADDRFLRDMVLALNAYREHVVTPQSWMATMDRSLEQSDARPMLASALAEECLLQHAELGQLTDARDAACVAGYRAALLEWATQLRASPQALSQVLLLISDCRLLAAPRGKGASPPPVLMRIRETWFGGRLKKRWDATKIERLIDSRPQAAALMRILRAVEARYATRLVSQKHACATYTFADIQRMVLDLLGTADAGQERTPTPIARELQRRYAHVLVDESQDTSPVQMELLRLVSRHAPATGGNWLLVGDVKQSIYGFREADPSLFVHQIDRVDADRALGRVLPLSDNFRTHAGVLDTLNHWFSRLFERRLGGTRFGPDEQIRAARDEIANPDLDDQPRVELHLIERTDQQHAPEGAPDQDDLEDIEREAQRAAERINALLAKGTRIPERTPEGELRLRALRPGDIAVLLRKASGQASSVARVLRASGLRCVASGRETLLDSIEVQDVVNVLQLLVNRRNDVALAAYLRSPLAGLTAAELLQIRGAAPLRDADFLDAVKQAAGATDEAQRPLTVRVKSAMEQLERWTIAAREDDVATLVRRIMHDTGLTMFALALRDGAQRTLLLEALRASAAAFNRPAAGIGEFVQQLDALRDTEQLGAASAPVADDAIRILTIHGAKGLEFPVVLLLDAGRTFNPATAQRALLCDATLGAGLRWYDAEQRLKIESAERFIIGEQLAHREIEEELRLLYVAATRARELLMIFGTADTGAWAECCSAYGGQRRPPLIDRLSANCHLEWVMMAAAGSTASSVRVEQHAAGSIRVARYSAAAADGNGAVLDDADRAWAEHGWSLLDGLSDVPTSTRPSVVSVSALKRSTRSESEEDSAAEAPVANAEWASIALAKPAFIGNQESPDGRVAGLAFHRVMQCIDLGRLDEPQREIEHLVTDGRLARADAAMVAADDIAWLADSDVGRMLRKAPEHVERELAFVWSVPVENNDRVIVRGVIDALVETDAGFVIVDYKTDTPKSAADLDARIAMYSRQIGIYGRAIEAIRQRPVARRVLVFVQARRLIEAPALAGPLLHVGSPASGAG